MLPPSHSVIQKALYNVIQARVMSRKRHSKMSKEAEAPGKTKAINPSCGTQDQNENGIFPKSEWEDAALHLCKRQINRDGEKENRTGWSQEKPSGAVNYMDLIMEPLRLAVM